MKESNLMSLVFEVSNDAKLIVQTNGKIYKYNKAAKNLFSDNDKDLGKKILWKIVRGNSSKVLKELFLNLKTKKHIRSEIELTINNGNKVFDVVGNSYISDDLHLLILRDITEKVRNLESRQQFMAIAGHELKTPLAVISAYTDLLKRRFEGDKKTLLYLGKISNKSKVLTNYINSILDEIRIGTGKLFFNDSELDFDKLATIVFQEMRTASADSNLKFSGETGEKIYADKERIAQVMRNLIVNAVKYSPRKKTIDVRIKKDGDYVVFSVADKGGGIPYKEQNLIFKAFYRNKDNIQKHKGGLGLGLYISKQIIDKYRGTIGVKSRLGAGSEFYFKLNYIR